MKTKNLWEKNKIRTWGAKILKCIGTFFICSLILYNILYVANNVFGNKKYVQIFGIYISTEKEKSMEPIIQKNSLIIGHKLKNVQQGEIVGYDIDNSNSKAGKKSDKKKADKKAVHCPAHKK